MNNKELKPVIEQSFAQYAGAVIQSRALVDVRDGLKPSARQIFYSMLLHKLIHKNPYKKTANAVGMAMADFYIHGDSSCEGVIMRASQGFSMRYPLVEVKGNAGTLIESGNWAAMRYTESRLSALMDGMFEDIEKDTIEEWRDNYDNTKQFPAVLPSKGYYNICNGTSGIATGMASSVPQYNIKELNEALCKLLDNPDCSFEDIYCAPDFATGAILYNEDEVKQSMKNGSGFACKLRSVVEFDAKERCFVVTEIPYGVYTNTICAELDEIMMSEDNPGVDRYNDLTGKTALIKIYLTKKANPDKVLRYLYKNTSLQSYFGINFTMLDHGRFPRQFTWKEMLQAHIEHEKEVYRRSFTYDLNKIDYRIHIIDGLLICLASIEEVVKMIKSSASTAAASIALQQNFLLDAEQAKAVLDMKLSRLAHLEVKKLEDEKASLLKESERISAILNDEVLFNNELKQGWRATIAKYGDARRTKIVRLSTADGDEPIERKQLSISITNHGAAFVAETSTLYTQKRNGVGSKFKLEDGEYIVENLVGDNTDSILFFTSRGNFYHARLGDFIVGEKQYLSNSIQIGLNDSIVAATVISKSSTARHIVFITAQGILKKSDLVEYNLKRNVGATAIKLNEGDSIVAALIMNDEKIGIATRAGNFIMIKTDDIRSIGRVAQGVCGIKLNDGDEVTAARIIPENTTSIVSVATDGYIKQTSFTEFRLTGRATKGRRIQRTESLCDFLPLSSAADVLVVASKSQIRIKNADIPTLSLGAQGAKAIKLSENSSILKLNTF